jgi:tetratricopeptide (TPR) repeat protein
MRTAVAIALLFAPAAAASAQDPPAASQTRPRLSMSDLRARLHFISQLIQTGRLNEAEASLQLVRADAPGEALLDGMEGFLLYRRHQYDRAAEILTRALATPNPPAWWRVVLSMSHFAAGREAQARQEIDVLWKGDPKGAAEAVPSMINAGLLDLRQSPSAAGALALSFLYQVMGNRRGALLALTDGARAAPKDVRLQVARAALLADLSEPPAGLKTIAEMLEAVGEQAALYRAQAVLYGRDKQFEPAAESWRKAVALDPNDLPMRLRLGAAYQQIGRTAEALAAFEKVAAAPDPAMSSAGYAALGAQLIEAKRWKEAEAALEKGLGIAPNRVEVINNLAWLYVTEGSEVRNPARALELALKAVALTEERNPAILDTLAEAYFANGDTAKAIETGRKATALAPANPSFRDHLARYEKAASAPK